MQQNELAKLLDISTAMVSRLAKRGMPTDTLERAQRWRKRHLEPGRVKGARFDPKRKATPTAPTPSTPAPAVAELAGELLAEVEAAALYLERALDSDDLQLIQELKQHVRNGLRLLQDGVWPSLPIAVWDVLTAEMKSILPSREGNPLYEDGSPVYVDSMTDEEAAAVGQFWLEVAAGKWIVDRDYYPPTH
jgi:hypothetical protein